MTDEAIKISGRQRIPRWTSLTAVLLCAVVLGGALALSARRLSVFAADSASSSSATERVVISVEGMYCDSCAAGIKAMLKRTPGVISADVSYKQREAIVEYDAQKTTPEKIVEAINNLGYKASVKNKG